MVRGAAGCCCGYNNTNAIVEKAESAEMQVTIPPKKLKS
jgi:hypothetical protein